MLYLFAGFAFQKIRGAWMLTGKISESSYS